MSGRTAQEYRLFFEGKFIADGTMSELAKKSNIALSTLSAHKSNKRSNSYLYEFIEIPSEVEFVLYRGDTFGDLGTKKELMKRYNIAPKEWAFYISPTAKKRAENRKSFTNAIIIERIEEDDENECISSTSGTMVKG